MEYWRKLFRERLAELKTTEALTQAKVAEICGVTQGTIGHWHRGERKPASLGMFRRLERALKLAPGTLTQPSPEEIQGSYLVAENRTPYKSSINIEIAEKATAFLMDEIGMEGMQKEGPAWVAETIIMLYDLFSDPASENLSKSTVMKMVANLHR